MRSDRDYLGARLFGTPIDSLGALVARMAEAYGDRPALQVPRDGALRHLSYRDLALEVARGARGLRSLGVQPGDRVVLLGENSPEWIVAAFAVFAAGAIAVPLDPQLSPEELETLLAHGAPRGAFASPRLVPMVQQALGASGFVISLEAAPGFTLALPTPPEPVDPDLPASDLPALDPSLLEPLAPGPSALDSLLLEPLAPDTVAALFYTSGTTGSPKGVMLTHRNLLFDASRCAEILYAKPGDNAFLVLPLHHVYSFTCMLVVLSCGGPATLPLSLKPESVLSIMRETRVTVLPAVPLLIDHLTRGTEERLAALPTLPRGLMRGLIRLSAALRPILGARLSRTLCRPVLERLGGLRLVIAGGAPLNPESTRFFHALGITVLNGYGLTETSPVLTLTPKPWREGDGVGKPLRGVELRLGPPNSEGLSEIFVRSDCVMAGYYRDPEATAAVMQDGWLNTQDLGRLDARGALHVLGRSKDVIVLASGKNVYPEDLERHYARSPLIRELCVIRGRDPHGAEFPLGVLVPNLAAIPESGMSPEALRKVLAQELTRLSQGLSDYKRLKRFEVSLEPLPVTTTRKLRRQRIQEAFAPRS